MRKISLTDKQRERLNGTRGEFAWFHKEGLLPYIQFVDSWLSINEGALLDHLARHSAQVLNIAPVRVDALDRTGMKRRIRELAREANSNGEFDKLHRAARLELALFSGIGSATGHEILELMGQLDAEHVREAA